MRTQLNPYLNFRDNTREAMEFYHGIFGGKLTMSTYDEYQVPADPTEGKKIMHAMLESENGLTFMAADTPNSMNYSVGTNFSMSLSGDNTEELRQYFDKLAEGGAIVMPLEKAPWGDIFGMCTDKFGVSWMVDVLQPKDETDK